MSLFQLRLKMIDLVGAGLISRQEYLLFAQLTSAASAVSSDPVVLPVSVQPIEYVDTDTTAPVFSFFEQLRAQGLSSGYERIGAGASGRQRSG